MKRHPYLLFLALVIFAGCKQDFELNAGYKELPVIYGLLNQQDATHYIRIQKGYLINGSAKVAAGINDSIYYPNILKVQLKSSRTNTVYTLTRVDGNSVVLNGDTLDKDDGIFSNTPNYLYKFNGVVDPTQSYTLTVTDTSSGKVVTAHTGLIQDFNIYSPARGLGISLSNNHPTSVTWQRADSAGIYDLTVRFFYDEYNQDGMKLNGEDLFIDIPVLRSYPTNDGNTITADFTMDALVKNLSDTLLKRNANLPAGFYRQFNLHKGMQFKFWAGGTALASFFASQQAQSGIASSNALPPYTNVDGGVGIFSSRYFKQVDSVVLSTNGIDSLACGEGTSGLRFKNVHGLVCD